MLVADDLKYIIEKAYADKNNLKLTGDAEIKNAVLDVIALLEQGKLRVAEQVNNTWKVNTWVKEAILLYFLLPRLKMVNHQVKLLYFFQV